MNKKGSLIRWKFVLPVALVVTGIVIFFVIFFDPLLERALESIGGRINGAKVEIDGLKTKFLAGRVSMERLQVANKNRSMQNIMEAGSMAFQVQLSELAGKRAIIDEATLRKLRFNTDRKTSGALPIRRQDPPGVAEKLVAKYQERFSLSLDGVKADLKAKIEFDPKELKVVQQGQALKANIEALPDQWKNQIASLEAEARLKKAQADLAALKSTPTKGADALTALPQAIKKLNQVKADLAQLKKEVNDAQTQFSGDIQAAKAGVVGLSKAREQDVKDMMSRLNLDFLSPQKIVEGIIGPAVLDKVQKAMHTVDVIRKNMPSKKESASLPLRERAQGRDILFPTPAALPKFWLKKAALEADVSGISGAGSLSNATSDPARIGVPTKMDLKGSDGSRQFSLVGVFDHTREVSQDDLFFSIKGLTLEDLNKSGGWADALSAGAGQGELSFGFSEGNTIRGRLEGALSQLQFDEAALFALTGIDANRLTDKSERLKADFVRQLSRSISKMPSLNVSARISGPWADPDIDLQTNLVSVAEGAIKSAFGSLAAEQRKEVEKKVDSVMEEQKAALQTKIEGLQKQLADQIAPLDQNIESALSAAAGLVFEDNGSGMGGALPSLKGLFKK